MSTKPKRNRRPDLVEAICEAIEEPTAHRASRSYAVMVHDVAKHLGINGEEVPAAIEAAGGQLACDSKEPYSSSLIYGVARDDAAVINAHLDCRKKDSRYARVGF